ncbi:MAG: serine hydroxymethyltransferase, partial [Planctomycetes bacterium]|nr:serine hydroxymethyltransferase [Planctomycetota bacterium]
QLIAAGNECSGAVIAALGSVFQNKTTEGFPGCRYHGGCEVVDHVERLATARAKEVFGAQYANVQPHSGSQANQICLTAILEAGDKILSHGLEQGGHPSHGGSGSLTGKFFKIKSYCVDKTSFLLDYDAIREQAIKVRPRLIMCGASIYAREIDFKRFREIADEVGAYLLADISHISGLVIAGAHPSCVDYAHFTTTSTYKAGGPRGGLILMGKDYDLQIKVSGKEMPLWKHVQSATFPGVQGTPYFNNMAAKAVFFKESLCDEFKARQFKVIENAKRLAGNLSDLGYDVLTGGTDNHMVLINVDGFREALTGTTAQRCLEDCGIVVDAMKLPYDEKPALITSGIRLGTPIVTKNGMGEKEMDSVPELIDVVLKEVKVKSDSEYEIDAGLREEIRDKVKELCGRFPMCY